VGVKVALNALGEAGHHPLRVWDAMTCLTSRGHAVDVFVTVNTTQIPVFRLGLCQPFAFLVVTGHTVAVGGVLFVGDDRGPVGRMAQAAALGVHLLTVGFMTGQTVRDVPVGYMALITVEIGVKARVLFHFFAHCGVTRDTGLLQITLEGNSEGCVGVIVASLTIG